MLERNFIPKGLSLRKKCGQIKTQQSYLHEDPIFSLGYTLIRVEDLLLAHKIVYIPSFQTLSKYLSLFIELSVTLTNHSFLVPQTILRFTPFSLSAHLTLRRSIFQSLKPSSKRLLRELLFNSPNMKWIIFFNENCKASSRSRRISFNESPEDYQRRLIQATVDYLSSTFQILPILIADLDDPFHTLELPTQQAVLTFEEFLQQINSTTNIQSVIRSYQLLASSDADLMSNLKMTGPKEKLFSPHLSWKEIEQGLNSGDLYIGTLKVSDFSSIHGEVVLRHGMVSSFADASQDSQWARQDSVLVSGVENMNRSLDGDTVVIQLLPRSAWKKIATHQILLAPVDAESEELEAAAASGFDEEGNESKSQDEVIPRDQFIRENPSAPALPTATVVGILKREVVEIVVTVPKFLNSTQGQLAIASASPTTTVSGDQSSSREEYVLCVPLNRKLPKIRIRTRKWQAIQGQRVVVGLDSWAIDSRYPEGHFTKCLGPKGDWKTEIEALLIKHSVFPRPFSVAALACLPPVPIQHEPLAMDSSSGGTEEPEFKSRKRNENQWRDSGWVPPAASLEGRRDMRSNRIFSVDPPGCQDIDDAMSIEWISDGLVEISVHIADVCAFVEQNSPLDLEAQVRSTTIYLSHKRIDMLPSLLSSDIASLHGNKERYALSMSFRVSVTHKDGSPVKESENQKAMELDDNGDIIFDIPTLPSWAGRSVIRSVAAMTYDQGDNLLNNLPPNASSDLPVPEGQAGRPVPQSLWSPLRGDLCMLTVFSRELQRARMRNGAIDLSQSEGGQLKFRLDENGLPVEVGDTPHKEIHDTIAELMILANGAAARLIYSVFPSATLFRSHTSPSLDRLREVQEITEGFGLSDVFLGQSDEALMSQVERFKKSLGKNRKSNPAVVHLVTSMVIRAMSEALYLCSENEGATPAEGGGGSETIGKNGQPIRHYGLGVQFYTHFTSPIRRYADVIVHRQLLRALEVQQRQQSQPTALMMKALSSATTLERENLVLPESKAISIVSESHWKQQAQPHDPSAHLEDDSQSHQIQMTRAADGRKMYDKIGLTREPIATVASVTEVIPPPPVLPAPASAERDEEDDLDLLDSLLDGIGGDLLDSVEQSRSQPNPPATLPLSLLAPVSHKEQGEEEKQEQQREREEDLEDELDALLGDIDENALSAAASASISVSVSSSRALPEDQSHSPVVSLTEKEEAQEKPPVSLPLVPLPPPYPPQQLASIADHLNKMNRRAKRIQFECQVLFLRHYFMSREEKHVAVIYALKENGFLAYVPALDFKGSVFLLTDDNTTVCCRPQLLALPGQGTKQRGAATGGEEAVTTLQHAGKMESLQRFPSHSCQILEAVEGTETELVICPKSQDPRAVTGAEGRAGAGCLRLRAMQRVVVSVYSSLSQSDGIPELCLQLWSTDLSSLNPKTDATLHRDASSSTLESKEVEAEDVSSLSSAVPPPAAPQSLYELLSDLLSKSSREGKSGAQSKGKKKAMTKRAQKVSSSRRVAFQGTGRVAYGDSEERELFAPLFHERAPPFSASSSQQGQGQRSHEGNLLRGKALAMHQMKLWGEEWAEEEDLPSAAYSGGEDPAALPSSSSGFSGLPEGFNVRKEVGIASQRVQKLKVAKRNSKY